MSATRCQSEHVEHGCFLISLQLRCSWCRKIKYFRIWSDTCYLWVFDLQFDMLASDTSSFPKPQQAIERNKAWGKALGKMYPWYSLPRSFVCWPWHTECCHCCIARIDIHGRKLQRTWTLLSKTVMAGETTLHLKHDPIAMGWQVGDRTGKHGETTMTLLTVTFGVTKCNKM